LIFQSFTGAAVEYRAASYFLAKGYQVYWPSMQQDTVDIVVEFPEGLRKVQVKKAAWSRSGYKTDNEYLKCSISGRDNRRYQPGDWDLLYIFADDGRIWRIPLGELPPLTALSLDKRGPTTGSRRTSYDPDRWREH
jgi:hypothetical protein